MTSLITSIDANVLVLFWLKNSELNERATLALRQAALQGHLIVCGPVFSELLGLPGRTPDQLQELLSESGIFIDWQLGEAVWREAGVAYQGYVKRRKASGGSMPRRILTDLLIGAHASVQGYQLLTLDFDTYRPAFPDLTIVRP